ncbi:MAG: hypothetical protein Q8R08_00865, partial [bacterium]|nr:hypothetical protein [bacterium]
MFKYVGVLRLYSMADLCLLLYLAGADPRQFSGAILMWVGFLFFLERVHDHPYPPRVKWQLWLIPYLAGACLYWQTEAMMFALCSVLYTILKGDMLAGPSTPLWRGLQNFLLVSGITGSRTPLPHLAAALTAYRNYVGDKGDLTQ